MLQSEYLVAHVVANLRLPLLMLEFLPRAELEDSLALLIGALLLPAPLFVLRNFRELDEVVAVVALDLEHVYELL